MKSLIDQIDKLRDELSEFEAALSSWEVGTKSVIGSRKYRSMARRIVLSAEYLEELVKEHTLY
jgi:hypothetical protein